MILRGDGNLNNERLVRRNILFKFKTIFFLIDNRFPVRTENSTERESALRLNDKMSDKMRILLDLLTYQRNLVFL